MRIAIKTSGPDAAVAALALGLTLATATGTVAAQEPGTDAEFELPRAPDELPPVLALVPHGSMVFPLADDPLCPESSDCIFQGGGGIGITLERRWPTGIVIGLGYDAWFLDASGVYELGLMHSVSAQIRYLFFPQWQIHPYLGVAGGALIFGDTLKIATVGLSLDVLMGVEIEFTHTLSLVLGTPLRLFITDTFTTPRDGVPRGEGGGMNAALWLQLGLAIIETPPS